jgi:hypothetical protein
VLPPEPELLLLALDCEQFRKTRNSYLAVDETRQLLRLVRDLGFHESLLRRQMPRLGFVPQLAVTLIILQVKVCLMILLVLNVLGYVFHRAQSLLRLYFRIHTLCFKKFVDFAESGHGLFFLALSVLENQWHLLCYILT